MRRKLTGVLVVVALAVTLGCPGARRGAALERKMKAEAHIAEQTAEIMEMYKDCLRRIEADASVDCSEFRKALEIQVIDMPTR